MDGQKTSNDTQLIHNCAHITAAQLLKVSKVFFKHNVDHKYSKCYSKWHFMVWQEQNNKNRILQVYLSTGRRDTKQPEADDVINVLKCHSANKGHCPSLTTRTSAPGWIFTPEGRGKHQELHLMSDCEESHLQSVLKNMDHVDHFLL